MQVAFISECTTFYKIISGSLSSKYPLLNFVHYAHPDLFINNPLPNYTHFIVKLTDRESFDLKIKTVKKKNSDSVIIGLIINREFKTLKTLSPYLDYVFNDSEIEEKLSMYFMDQFNESASGNNSDRLEIEINKRKYIQLNTKLSRCLVLISQNKTAAEIAVELSKSERTIEKYITFLRKYFGVNKKKELIDIVIDIANVKR